MNLIHIVHPLNAAHWTQPYEMYLAQELKEKATPDILNAIANKNNYKILDNGCYENDIVDLDSLFEVAEKIKASEIILPDVMGNFDASLRATTDALEYAVLHGYNRYYKFMAVCQGETWEDYMASAQLLSTFREVTCIGIPKKFCRNYYSSDREAAIARSRFALEVAQMTEGRKDIHMLGLSWSVLELSSVGKVVRTCDTNNIVENVKSGDFDLLSWESRGEKYTLNTPMTSEELIQVIKTAEFIDKYINNEEASL